MPSKTHSPAYEKQAQAEILKAYEAMLLLYEMTGLCPRTAAAEFAEMRHTPQMGRDAILKIIHGS